MATMTLIGLYNYDNTLFDKMALPDILDFDTVKNSILMSCAEFEPLYPSPDALKTAIEYWSKGKLHSWNKIATALYHEYDPFINFARDEVRTIETEFTNDSTNSVSAWNEDSMQKRDKTDSDGKSKSVETFHSQGDSAMFTPTDVARKESELRITFDLIDIIIDSFKNTLVLQIY